MVSAEVALVLQGHLLEPLDSIGDRIHQIAFLGVGQTRPYRVQDLGVCDVLDDCVFNHLPAGRDSFANCVYFGCKLWYRKRSGVLKCSNDLQIYDRSSTASNSQQNNKRLQLKQKFLSSNNIFTTKAPTYKYVLASSLLLNFMLTAPVSIQVPEGPIVMAKCRLCGIDPNTNATNRCTCNDR
jgi:hypothetical protein